MLPVTELQRNMAALVDEAMQTKEPVYLTRRGFIVRGRLADTAPVTHNLSEKCE